MRAIDTLARFGGDEFALLMADIGDPTDAGVLADKLLQIMAKPFLLDGNQIQSGVSIGIATYEPDTAEAEALLAHADVALYRAKSEGRHTYRFFTGAMDAEVRKRVALTSELQAGIAAGQLFLVYQPQVDMETSRLVGLEALVRWNHPTRGVLLPGEFLPAAERSGLIVMLGNWVLRSACRQAQQWLETGVALPPLAVNVSALQFKAPRELENEIEAALAETGSPAQIAGNRDDGNRADGDFERARQRRRAAARPRAEDRDRRFRHGLFLAALPSALSGRSDQNRAGIRQGYRHRSQRHGDRQGGDRPGARAGNWSHGRGRGNGRPGAIAARVGMPTGTGILLCRANAGGRCSAALAQRQRHALAGRVVDRSQPAAAPGGCQATTRPSRSQKRRVALNPKRTHSPGVATPGRPVCFSRSACCSVQAAAGDEDCSPIPAHR